MSRSTIDRFDLGGPRLPRAGLRGGIARQEPTGLFAVIEMTVLVVVTALAMVSIIVTSGGDDVGSGRAAPAASSHHVGFGLASARRVDDPDDARAERPR